VRVECHHIGEDEVALIEGLPFFTANLRACAGGWRHKQASGNSYIKSGLLLVALVFPLLIMACSSIKGVPLTPQERLEERAYAIDKTLICPVCPGETINQSRVELAEQMRAIVREKLAEGWSDNQIRQFFVDRYGPSVLAEPPRRGFTLAVWILPPVAFLAAAGGLIILLKAMSKPAGRASQAHATREGDESLEPYLSMVDSEAGHPVMEKKATRARPKSKPSGKGA
jgi:cytochrome c-type biogenesis protein CcmH